MSDPSSTDTESTGSPTGSPKKKVSPARNAVGIVGLIVMIVVAAFQYSAVFGYNAALKALAARSQDEDKGLLDVAEAESLLKKSSDGPGSDFEEGNRTFTKTTYTWRGAIKSYTLTLFYTKGPGPCLHHYEPDGTKYVPEAVVQALNVPGATAPGPRKAREKKKATGPADGAPKTAAAPVPGAAKANTPAPAAEAPKAAAAADPVAAKANTPAPAAEPSKPAATPAPAVTNGPT